MRKWILAIIWGLLSLPLVAQQQITLVTDEWPPYFSPDSPEQGMLTHIAREAFATQDIDMQVKFVPWKRALAATAEGLYDGILGAFYTRARSESFLYSRPIWHNQMVFAKQAKQAISYHTLQDLTPYSICLIRGYFYSSAFTQADYLTRVYANEQGRCLERLLAGRVDLFLVDNHVLNTMMKARYPYHRDQIDTLQPPLSTNSLHILFPKVKPDSQQLLDKLEKGLTDITESGLYDELIQRYH